MTTPTNDRRHLAVHEAAHAVTGRKLGFLMGSATIEQDEDSAGHNEVGDPYAVLSHWELHGAGHRAFDTAVRARALIFMVGAEAEVEILGRCPGGDGDDRREVALSIEALTVDAAEAAAMEHRLRRMARRLVRRHRDAIKDVATELDARGTVLGRELDAMVPGPAEREPDPLWTALLEAEIESEPISLAALVPVRPSAGKQKDSEP